MKNFILLLSFLVLAPNFLSAQNHRTCTAMEHLEIQKQNDPSVIENMNRLERFTQNYVANATANQRAAVTIPVVVHVVYKTSAQNISQAQVQSQIDVLNADFQGSNIDFCLVETTRTSTKKRSFSYSNDGIKFASSGGVDAWPTDQYLNIWVGNLGNGLLGYAQFPGGAANTDGVVCLYTAFGTNGVAAAPYDGGRTTTHEVGHWLNLRHIWGDGGCGVDDFVADTPESDAPNYGCPTGHVSCGSVDQIENYMDYTYDACMDRFTNGQIDRMQAAIANSRSGFLTTSCGTNPPAGCDTPTGLGANPSNNGASLSWNAVSGAETYNVSINGSVVASVTGTSYTASGLSTCTGYTFSVQADCASASSGTASSSFTTTGCTTGPCDAPSNFSFSNSKRKSVKLNWNAVSGANSYDAQYRVQGSNNWTTKSTTGTNVTLNGINNGTTYEYHVRSNCSGSSSDYSATGTFTHGVNGARIMENAAIVFPNPANEQLTLAFMTTGDVEITMFDLLGRKVFSQNINTEEQSQLKVNTQAFDTGLYILQIVGTDGTRQMEKIIVRH